MRTRLAVPVILLTLAVCSMVVNAEVEFFFPTEGGAVPSGGFFRCYFTPLPPIEECDEKGDWQACAYRTEYSIDGGMTWEEIEGANRHGGNTFIPWEVPHVESDSCYLRLVNPISSIIVASVGPFSIRTPNKPVTITTDFADSATSVPVSIGYSLSFAPGIDRSQVHYYKGDNTDKASMLAAGIPISALTAQYGFDYFFSNYYDVQFEPTIRC